MEDQLSILNNKLRKREAEKETYRSRIRKAQEILAIPQVDINDELQAKTQQKVSAPNTMPKALN